MTALIVTETAVLVVLTVLVFGLLRAYATVLQRLHRLDGRGDAAGDMVAPPFRTAVDVVEPRTDRTGPGGLGPRPEWGPAHDISGQGLTGEIVSIRVGSADRDTVLVFLSSGCSGCANFWEQFADGRAGRAVGGSRVLVVTKGAEQESPALLAELASPGLDVVMSSQAWTDYHVPGSPYVIVVDGPSGRIKGEGSGTSLTQVSGLMRQANGDSGGGPGRRTGKPRSDSEREVDVDRTLLAAGIGPGHPSLYPTENDGDQPQQRRQS